MNNSTKIMILALASDPDKDYNYDGEKSPLARRAFSRYNRYKKEHGAEASCPKGLIFYEGMKCCD